MEHEALKLREVFPPLILLPSIPDEFAPMSYGRCVVVDVPGDERQRCALSRTRTAFKSEGGNRDGCRTQFRGRPGSTADGSAELNGKIPVHPGLSCPESFHRNEMPKAIFQVDSTITAVALNIMLPDKRGMEILVALSQNLSPSANAERAQTARRLFLTAG